MSDKESYNVYSYGDKLEMGRSLKLEHTISYNKYDISNYILKSADSLIEQRNESANKEKDFFDGVLKAAEKWEAQAAKTQLIDKAIQYVKTPAVKHTDNKWIEDEYHCHIISNTVYKMYYRIQEDTNFDWNTKKRTPVAWNLSWSVYLQDPGNTGNSSQIAGQDRKRFTDKAVMEKYMQGRIKAYSDLFKEVSPPIPKEYIRRFYVNNQLLPGYTVESEKEKSSILEQLTMSKENLKARTQEHYRKGNKLDDPPHLSPWGEIQTCNMLYPGVFKISTEKNSGIMVADEVSAILSPVSSECGDRRGGFLCFDQEKVVLHDLISKKLISEKTQALQENIKNTTNKPKPKHDIDR